MKKDSMNNENADIKECDCGGDCGCGEDCSCHETGEHECGCGHDHDHGVQTVTLSMDDGQELECSILGVFDVLDKEYIALLPLGEENVLVYTFKEENGQPILGQIETDEEYAKVAEVFDELFSGEEDEE